MELRIEEIGSLSDDNDLLAAWTELLADRPNATPFETYEWHLANLLSFRPEQIRILTFFDGLQMVGVIPLVLRTRRKYMRQKRWLEFAGLPFADYGTCLIRSGFEEGIADLLLDYLRCHRAEWDGVYLDNLRQSNSFLNYLPQATERIGLFYSRESTHRIRRLMRGVNPTSGLQDSKSLAKAKKKISREGELSFGVSTEISEIQAQLESYFRMHMDRCAAKGLKSQLAGERHQAFYRNIVAACGVAGQVWLSTLYCANQAIASRFSMRFGKALHLYSTCFAPAFSRYSPSMLQLEMLLNYAFASGIEVIDFGMGDSPQKEKAGADEDCRLERIELYHSRQELFESRFYRTAQRKAAQSGAVRKTGRVVRKFLPYQG